MAAKKKSAKKASAKGKPKAARPADPAERASDAALDLAAKLGWRHTTLGDIAAAAGLSLAELYDLYPSKGHVVAGLMARIDRQVLAGDFADLAGEPAKDRLFDVLMRRFDALKPHRPGIAAIVKDGCAEPATVLCAGCGALRSMSWMLEAAGLSAGGLKGRLRAKGLLAIWALAFRTFLKDDSEDLSETMAVLDKALSRADDLMSRRPPRWRRPAAEAA